MDWDGVSIYSTPFPDLGWWDRASQTRGPNISPVSAFDTSHATREEFNIWQMLLIG